MKKPGIEITFEMDADWGDTNDKIIELLEKHGCELHSSGMVRLYDRALRDIYFEIIEPEKLLLLNGVYTAVVELTGRDDILLTICNSVEIENEEVLVPNITSPKREIGCLEN